MNSLATFKFLFILSTILALSSYCLALKCYSCSTKNGDQYCAEDVFNPQNIPVIQCPNDADVCVRLKQKNDGSIFRSCGKICLDINIKIILFVNYYLNFFFLIPKEQVNHH